MRENKLGAIQFLRFIAFFNIFMLHSNNIFLVHNGELMFVTNSFFAVSFFIVLSGFLYGLRFREQEPDLSQEWQFVKKRVSKFYPLHIALLFLIIPLTIGTPMYAYVEHNYAALGQYVLSFFLNAALLHNYYRPTYLTFNGVSWFLTVMVLTAVLTLPLAKLFRKLKASKNGNAKLWILFFVFIGIDLVYGLCIGRFIGHSYEFYIYAFPPARLAEYACGLILGLQFREKSEWKGATVFEMLAFVMAGLLVHYTTFLPEYISRTFVWIIPDCIVLWIFANGQGLLSKLFSLKLLQWLGNISFECFMIHCVIILYLLKIYPVTEETSFVNLLMIWAYWLFTTLLVGGLLHRKNR